MNKAILSIVGCCMFLASATAEAEGVLTIKITNKYGVRWKGTLIGGKIHAESSCNENFDRCTTSDDGTVTANTPEAICISWNHWRDACIPRSMFTSGGK
jgi:hypothetical protein